MTLLWIVLFTLLGGAASASVAGALLLVPDRLRERLLPSLVSYAVGAMLAAAFLGLLPEAFEQPGSTPQRITAVLLGGILLFFVLEKFVLWRHCHTDTCAAHGSHAPPATARPWRAAGTLVLIGDSVHNLIDGVLIAAAFLTDARLGVLTALAIVAHEIPQEIGDVAVLVHSGYSRRKAMLYNLLTNLPTLIGGVLAYFALDTLHGALPYVLTLAAASFIYIAVADLIPDLHRRPEPAATLAQVLLIGAGIGTIVLSHVALEHWLH
jgi:zinc and cadmium transporter